VARTTTTRRRMLAISLFFLAALVILSAPSIGLLFVPALVALLMALMWSESKPRGL
jgi:hypothetical protein